MSRDPLAPLGDAFDQAFDEMGAFVGFVFLLFFAIIVYAIFVLVVEYQGRKSQPNLGPWEDPIDATGLGWFDASLHIGEAIEWS